MSLRPQNARPAPLHETLARQLNQRDLRMVESTLAHHEPQEVLTALAIIVETERRRERVRQKLGLALNVLMVLGFVAWVLVTYEGKDIGGFILMGVIVRVVLAYVGTVSKGETLRGQNARFVLPACIQRADRASLGPVLILAETGLVGSSAERSACRSFLEGTLVRTPADELLALSERQRAALRFVTQRALKLSRSDNRYTQLASAGLLALGTLRDSRLLDDAHQAMQQHTRGPVCAAAEEYLGQIAN
jgi:hypothetical protein